MRIIARNFAASKYCQRVTCSSPSSMPYFPPSTRTFRPLSPSEARPNNLRDPNRERHVLADDRTLIGILEGLTPTGKEPRNRAEASPRRELGGAQTARNTRCDRKRTADAANALKRLAGKLSTSAGYDPIASLRWSWCRYRIQYRSEDELHELLGLLERKREQVVFSVDQSASGQVVAHVRRVVEAIASGDIKRAASAISQV